MIAPCPMRAVSRRGAPLTDAQVAVLTRDLLREGRAVRLAARGSSMRPALRDGDIVTARPCDAHRARKGDVLLCLEGPPDAPRGLTIHRLVSRDSDRVFLRGDACRSPDPPRPLAAVVGRIESLERHGRRRPVGRTGQWPLAISRVALSVWGRVLRLYRGAPPLGRGSSTQRGRDALAVRLAIHGGALAADMATDPRYERFHSFWSHRVREGALAAPDDATAARLSQAADVDLLRSARAEGMLEEIDRLASRAGLRLVAAKGAALAFGGVYPAPHLRPAADIDTLCADADRQRVVRILLAAGFANAEPEYPIKYYLRWRREAALFLRRHPRWPTLEVHWGCAGHGYYDPRLPAADLVRAARPGPWGRGALGILPAEFEALLGIVHFTKHLRGPSPMWPLDLALLDARGLDWRQLEQEIRRRRLQWPAFYALRWADDRAPGIVPDGMIERLRRSAPRGPRDLLEMRVLHAPSPDAVRWVEALTLPDWQRRLGYLGEHILPHRAVIERLYPEARGRCLARWHLKRWGRILGRKR